MEIHFSCGRIGACWNIFFTSRPNSNNINDRSLPVDAKPMYNGQWINTNNTFTRHFIVVNNIYFSPKPKYVQILSCQKGATYACVCKYNAVAVMTKRWGVEEFTCIIVVVINKFIWGKTTFIDTENEYAYDDFFAFSWWLYVDCHILILRCVGTYHFLNPSSIE